MRFHLVSLWVLLGVGSGAVFAQADPAQLTLERIFNSGDFRGESDPLVRWVDGQSFTHFRPSTTVKNGSDLVKVDAATGAMTVLISAEKLVPPGMEPLRIDDFSFSKDGDVLLIFTKSVRVWRRNTRGEYWTYRVSTSQLVQHGKGAAPSTLMFAKLSPDGKTLGYVRENNLYTEPTDGGQPTALTKDGSTEIINGTFDWVYEEEFDCRDGWRFSPDGKSIAYWQLDTKGVPLFTMVDNVQGKYPKLITFPYPKTGEQNSHCRVGVIPAQGGQTTWIKIPGETKTDYYLPRMEWTGQPGELLIQRVNRLQNANDYFLANAQSGEAQLVTTDRDGAWVDIHDDANHWLENGSGFTVISEKDGWRHLYLVSRNGMNWQRITHDPFDVVRVLKIDEKEGMVYFLGSQDQPTEQYLYRTPLNGKGEAQRVTPPGVKGWNDYQVRPTGTIALWTQSSFGEPPVSQWIDLSKHQVIRPHHTNEKLKQAVSKLARTPVEFFRVGNGLGEQLDAWLIKPPGFDPEKKYPLLFHVYGEPAGATVVNRWGGSQYLWHQMLAQHGYLVASIDNRGTHAPRGRDWRKSVYRKIGTMASQDQAAATRELLSKRPYIDPSRIGVWGWSGGGSMTLNLMFRSPDIYKLGMSVAPVPDMNLYDTIYQERYMGLPQTNQKDYQDGSPITHAPGLKGHLLLIHGTGDDNCHYQGMEKLIDTLIAENKIFSVLPYPNRSHSISEGRNTTRHLYGLLTNYLEKQMPPGAK